MRSPLLVSSWVCLLLSLGVGIAAGTLRDTSRDIGGAEFFERKIRPLLAQNCYVCHSAQTGKHKGGLQLDSRAALLKGGDTGTALVPGHPEQSRLIEALSYQNPDLRMPPRGKLPAAVLNDLAIWIRNGAVWGQESASAVAATPGTKFDLLERRRTHWAWQPLHPSTPPAVQQRDWPTTALDAFILARLEKEHLGTAPPADRNALIRRVYFDLIGLPPTPAEVEEFLADRSPAAYGKVVDRLLASPHFGERWARHWLDLVRYADSRGHEFDFDAPNAYQYRDYVIRALNADVPYDRFVTEQIAGDLIEQPRRHPPDGFNESLLGTGFWYLGEQVHSPVDIRQDQTDRLDNMVDVMGKTFLGLTVACARCHDHKFDAISSRDYYALCGFLESSHYRLVPFEVVDHNRPVAERLQDLRHQHRQSILHALGDALRPGVSRTADYLLAAREVMAAQPSFDDDCIDDPSLSLRRAAWQHGLDRQILGRWVGYLSGPAAAQNDPLHDWMTPGRFAASPAERTKCKDTGASSVVVDYRTARPREWIQDGVAYAHVDPGDVRFAADPARPIAGIVDSAAAESDPALSQLQPAPGSQLDPASLGQLLRAGRSLFTPSFRITTGKLFYRVRGSGQAYAAVDGHVLINGPLHGQLIRSIRTADGFEWIEHDLTPYLGHLAHVEFTPAIGGTLAVAEVIQATQAPAVADSSQSLLAKALKTAAHSAQERASAYQRLLNDVLEDMAADRIRTSPDAPARAHLADWLVRNASLFSEDPQHLDNAVRATCRPFMDEQRALIAQLRTTSHLAMAMIDGTGVDEHVLIRGSSKILGVPAPRRFLEALAGAAPLHTERGSGRLELARQMIDPAIDPLLPRVMVNRIWHHLFGRGIVASVDNFGVLGEHPSHPELLDFLACQFIRDGWSIKKTIRTLVLSSTYRMSAHPDEHADRIDPENVLLHRQRVRRLEGEAIRDAILAISGRLDGRMYGPPVPLHLSAFQEGRGRPADGPLDGDGRRSIYLAVRRNFLSPLLLTFDTPIPFSTMGRRSVSNVPAQALILMNDPFAHEQAKEWAHRVLHQAATPRQRIELMYRTAYARPPTAAEVASCLAFLEQQSDLDDEPANELNAWADLAHVLFNVKEFIFVN